MPKNVHAIERVFRFLLGVFVLSLIFWGPKTWWGLLGLIPLLTSFVGSCPLYTVLGVSTCKKCQPPTHAESAG
ncbi:MAG: DUF2892 domain-containing protein [Deltaproteobacteria bacterium]|nr:MAG: DUF2892 domain-containing protein [Deltaproteobacteria bacterium]